MNERHVSSGRIALHDTVIDLRPAPRPSALDRSVHRRDVVVVRHHRGARRFGYLVAIAVNAVMLWMVHQLLDWRWPAFLTDDFGELLTIITVSFVATMIVNAAYIGYDRGWFKSLGTIVTSAIGFVVVYRTLQVFPFDFSGYARDWSSPVRLFLLVSLAITVLSLVVETIKLLTWPLRDHDPESR
jgi:hypothetical protein